MPILYCFYETQSKVRRIKCTYRKEQLYNLLLFDINYGGMDNEVERDYFTEKGTMWEMPIQIRNH